MRVVLVTSGVGRTALPGRAVFPVMPGCGAAALRWQAPPPVTGTEVGVNVSWLSDCKSGV